MAPTDDQVVIDTDVLSQIARGSPAAVARARQYLDRHGRFTVTAISVYERLRGYHQAIRDGKPFAAMLKDFEAALRSFLVLPFDAGAADVAARIWAGLSKARRRAREDILVAAVAAARGLPLATLNRGDYDPMATLGVGLRVTDWS